MRQEDIDKLRSLTDFPSLVGYLRDELDWPIDVGDADEVVFDYDPAELGIDPQYAVKIDGIRQIRPLVDAQPWAIFYIEFESKRLPVVVLRRILRALVHTSRRQDPNRPAWRMDDLLFISAQGEEEDRSISFAHFRQREDRVPELRTFSWDSKESHFYYLKNLNLEALRWPDHESDADTWRDRWRQAFTIEHRYVIRKSQELARQLAHHAAMVRDLVSDVFELETKEGALHRLYESFRLTLLHDLEPGPFADMVAQTVAYGMFSARAHSDELTYDSLLELIPDTNPFLRDLLAELTSEGGVDLEELGIGQLLELLRQTDVDAILKEFGRRTGAGREDPVVHFYELFLRQYDSAQKVRRGVFYTPDPVVSYIVRSVDHLLTTDFGLEDGLADTTPDPGTGEPMVQILDPAAGTGTFLVHVIDRVARTIESREGALDWSGYVAKHLMPRLFGFELMMAPYAVGHMKLALKLQQTGYRHAGTDRLQLYLTNTVHEPIEVDDTLGLAGFLSTESSAASHVKAITPVTVVLGNPPYRGLSLNKGPWIDGLLKGRLPDGTRVTSYYVVDGEPLSEKKLWLQDDYVKFIRWAHWRILQTGWGILAFITNHGYLDNPTFRGMRQQLMKAFEDIYILNLHGGGRRGERGPDGLSDENVFDIRQGVAIAVFVKRPGDRRGDSSVRYSDLWGPRGVKYDWLSQNEVATTPWARLRPRSPFYLFVPQDTALAIEYERSTKLTSVVPVHVTGIVTARDLFVLDFDEERLLERIGDFADPTISDDEIRERYFKRKGSSKYPPGDTRGWKLPDARRRVQADADWRSRVASCLYRPFDIRPLYNAEWMVDWPRPDVMAHMVAGENMAIISARSNKSAVMDHFFATRHIAEAKCAESTTQSCAFPLYLYPSADTQGSRQDRLLDRSPWPRGIGGRVPNLSADFIADMEQRLQLDFLPDARGDLSHTFGPEDVFEYAYALFHSLTYRTRFAQSLGVDYPRVPVTQQLEMFSALVGLGADLVALHLLEDDYVAASWTRQGADAPFQRLATTFVKQGTGTTLGALSKTSCYRDGRVYLDTSRRNESSYFDGVPEDVWNFQIGGYQVCHKWLYDRRGKRGEPGRTLTQEDIIHYQRIVVAIKETIRLMGEIDEVIDAHGGWPIQ